MTRKRAFSKHIPWEQRELEIVQKMFATAKWSELLSALPGRSRGSIEGCGYRLGISRTIKPTRTADEVRKCKREQMARRRAADIEGARKYAREYHYKNREHQTKKMREYGAKRFFWNKSTKLRGWNGAKPAELSRLWKKQRGRCALTGRRLDRSAQIDHVLPRVKGGSDEISNLQWLCADANYAKRALKQDEFLQLCKDVVDNTVSIGHYCRIDNRRYNI